jgi:hypothetical protein
MIQRPLSYIVPLMARVLQAVAPMSDPDRTKRPKYILQDRGERHVVSKRTGQTVPMKHAVLMNYGKTYPSHGAKRGPKKIPVVPFGVAAE